VNLPRLGLGLLVVALTAGCSGLRPYPNTLEKNVQIRTETASGSIFSSTRAQLGIYRVDAQCRIEYEGTLDLDKPVVLVGLPADRPSYLVFCFSSSSFLANTRSSIRQETLLRTRPDHSYRIDVTYRNSIYNVVVREHLPRKGGSREVALRRLGDCRE
jgi:hypothetical protein